MKWLLPLCVTLFALAGCAALNLNQTNAFQVLQAFCKLKQHDIFTVLLTEDQRRAGQTVCAAIGLPEGTR
jgi:hypothetical protein